jgi:hypothetical protein
MLASRLRARDVSLPVPITCISPVDEPDLGLPYCERRTCGRWLSAQGIHLGGDYSRLVELILQ